MEFPGLVGSLGPFDFMFNSLIYTSYSYLEIQVLNPQASEQVFQKFMIQPPWLLFGPQVFPSLADLQVGQEDCGPSLLFFQSSDIFIYQFSMLLTFPSTYSPVHCWDSFRDIGQSFFAQGP